MVEFVGQHLALIVGVCCVILAILLLVCLPHCLHWLREKSEVRKARRHDKNDTGQFPVITDKRIAAFFDSVDVRGTHDYGTAPEVAKLMATDPVPDRSAFVKVSADGQHVRT